MITGLKADCTLKMKDADCFKMMVGQLNPQTVSKNVTFLMTLFDPNSFTFSFYNSSWIVCFSFKKKA